MELCSSVSPQQVEADTGEVATPARQDVTVDITQLAALWTNQVMNQNQNRPQDRHPLR